MSWLSCDDIVENLTDSGNIPYKRQRETMAASNASRSILSKVKWFRSELKETFVSGGCRFRPSSAIMLLSG